MSMLSGRKHGQIRCVKHEAVQCRGPRGGEWGAAAADTVGWVQGNPIAAAVEPRSTAHPAKGSQTMHDPLAAHDYWLSLATA
jgi:hypothetical protein